MVNKRSLTVNLVQRNIMWLMAALTLHLLAIIVQVSDGTPTEEAVPVSVNRRLQEADILTFTNSSQHRNCYADTYLVDERRCVNNQSLHNACRFAISSRQDLSSYQITLFINDQGQFQSSIVVATYEPHGQCCSRAVNNSLCRISSLEVYRGRQQAIEISHDGLSLTEDGAINMNQSSLAYSVMEYIGELYRMNLSCTGGGLPESGCLFFKVGGTTNLTKAKFADRVPGTIQTPEDHMTTITIGTVSSTTHPTTDHEIFSYPQTPSTSSNTIIPTMPYSSTSYSPSNATVATNLMIYVISAAAGGVAALLLVVILLSMVLVYCIVTNKTNITTSNNNNEDTRKDQRQLEQSNEASAPPLRNLWCEQSDMMSVIPINFPMRQTVPFLTDTEPVYAEVEFMNEAESPGVLLPPTDYHNNPAYIHFTKC